MVDIVGYTVIVAGKPRSETSGVSEAMGCQHIPSPPSLTCTLRPLVRAWGKRLLFVFGRGGSAWGLGRAFWTVDKRNQILPQGRRPLFWLRTLGPTLIRKHPLQVQRYILARQMHHQ